DHDHAVHAHGVEHQPHRVDGRLVRRLLLAAPDPACGGERRVLGRTDQFQREVAVYGRALLGGAQRTPGGLRARACSAWRRTPAAQIPAAPSKPTNQPIFSSISESGLPGLPRMIPFRKIRTNAVIPTIIVTSPGLHVSAWPRATIQARMNGALQAATSRMSSSLKVWKALKLPRAPLIWA